MDSMKLNVLKPSVNNMAVRVFVRAANLEFTEDDVYGKTRTTEFLAKNPAHMTPMLETGELPKGGMWESCAIMQYLCNKHEITKFYPKPAEQSAVIDSAMFYLIGTLYPLVARATYPALGFPQYPGEVGASDADTTAKQAAQKAAIAAIAEPLDVFHKFYMDAKPFIGGATVRVFQNFLKDPNPLPGRPPPLTPKKGAAPPPNFFGVFLFPAPCWAK